MQLFVDWCGFIGAWLLVAGPIYQAALELREEEIEQEHISEARKTVPRNSVSPWWWLLPPVKVLMERKQDRLYRQAFLDALPNEDVAALISYLNKASAWLYVAMGGLLLATNETYMLTHALHWKVIIFWIIVLVCSGLCVVNTAYRIARSENAIAKHK